MNFDLNFKWIKLTFLLLLLVAFLLLSLKFIIYGDHRIKELPLLALYSLRRMFIAYLLSFLFALTYGYIAATNRWAEKVMLPSLDILQSVPVLGFFPLAVLFLIGLFRGSSLGVELASIFLIFTGQAWNMAFGVYESLTTIPGDLSLATKLYGLNNFLKFKRLLFPACIPKLVYNSMMSWAGGWYFLMACEIISLGEVEYKLPGLGSFLMEASIQGETGLILIGLGLLIIIIIALDFLAWRPLSIWSERFKYEYSASGSSPQGNAVLNGLRYLLRKVRGSSLTLKAQEGIRKLIHPLIRIYGRYSLAFKKVKRVFVLSLFLLLGFALSLAIVYGILWLVDLFLKPLPKEAKFIPLALLYSMARLAIGYLICLAWTIPVAVIIGQNERLSKYLTPLIEITASIPATAFFPLIVILVIEYTGGGMNVAAILLILTGMQWYLLFNLIAGVRSIPADLDQAARSLGLSGWLYWRRLLLPALYPSLVTGSITAWGGGWNALIVSEYLTFRGTTYSAFGIGMLLDEMIYEKGDSKMAVLILVSMIVTVVLLNRLIWHRLYERAALRYKFEY